MKKVGIVGWRGMVGSVLIKRLKDEGDLQKFIPTYFSTSTPSVKYVNTRNEAYVLSDATSVDQLAAMDIIITCQGGDYTKSIYPKLRATGWDGYWIDAASAKRMDSDSVIALDPVNRAQIDSALSAGCKNFIGGNCSITLTLLGLAGLFKAGLIEWMSLMTYQAASGAGASHVRELLSQMKFISDVVSDSLGNSGTPISHVLEKARSAMNESDFPMHEFGVPLAGSIIPWIDSDLENGSSREEWKSEVETNKILSLPPGSIRVDGLCVRVGALQSHSAAVTFKLKQNTQLEQMEAMIKNAHEWVEYVPNNKSATLGKLSPAAVSGTLKVRVGRLKRLSVDENIFSVMTVGDQLLWGAAEPLRRVLNIILGHSHNR